MSERVTWRDASLGCPEPERTYAQVLVDGGRIVLRAAAGQAVADGTGRPPFRCDHPDPSGATGVPF